MSQHDTEFSEQGLLEERRKKIEVKVREFLKGLFEEFSESEERAKEALVRIEKEIANDFTKSHLQEDQIQAVRNGLRDALQEADVEMSFQACLKVLRPLIEIRVRFAKEHEDYQARKIMRDQGFIQLNERISYNVGEHGLQLHLAPAYEVKGKIEALYRDALEKIVPIVQANPDIWVIGGTSWINATRTYGAMKERLGFTLSDTPEEVVKEHFAHDERPLKDATMTREEFLARYAS